MTKTYKPPLMRLTTFLTALALMFTFFGIVPEGGLTATAASVSKIELTGGINEYYNGQAIPALKLYSKTSGASIRSSSFQVSSNSGSTWSSVSSGTFTKGKKYRIYINVDYSVGNAMSGSYVPDITLNGYGCSRLGYTSTDITVVYELSEPYTVSFYTDSNDTSEYAAVSVPRGSSLGSRMPADPAKTNYVFKNWYTGSSRVQTTFTSSTAVTADTKVYASWRHTTQMRFLTEGDGTISVTADGENVDTTARYSSQYIGTEITMKATPAPGKVFKYWLYSFNGSSPWRGFSNGKNQNSTYEPELTFNAGTAENYYIKAVFADGYNINVIDGKATTPLGTEVTSIAEDNPVCIKADDKEDYVFDKWEFVSGYDTDDPDNDPHYIDFYGDSPETEFLMPPNDIEIKATYVPLEYYDLYVCGVQVSNKNKGDILGDRVFEYDNETKTLFIKGNVSETDERIIDNQGIDGLTINVRSNSKINNYRCFLFAGADTTLTGSGKLDVKTTFASVYVDEKVTFTIKDTADVTLYSWGIGGNNTIMDSGNTVSRGNKLIIDNANVRLTNDTYSTVSINTIELKNCDIVSPEGAYVTFSLKMQGISVYKGSSKDITIAPAQVTQTKDLGKLTIDISEGAASLDKAQLFSLDILLYLAQEGKKMTYDYENSTADIDNNGSNDIVIGSSSVSVADTSSARGRFSYSPNIVDNYYKWTMLKQLAAREGLDYYSSLEIITPHEHVLEHHDYIAPTCTNVGYREYWYCKGCDRYFSDSESKNETTPAQIIISATGHTNGAAVKENEAAATCAAAGGYDSVVYCTVCKEELSRTHVTYPQLTTHTPAAAVKENVVEATCKAGGSYDSVIYCSVCKDELIRTNVTTDKLTTHTPAAAVKENEVAATCTKDGGYDSVIYCKVCGAKLSSEHVTVNKLGHTFGEWKVTKAATENANGLQERVCSTCGEKETQVIPALTHTHSLRYVAAAPASCTKEGSSAYYECTSCLRIFSDAAGTKEITKASTVISKTAHTPAAAVKENVVAATTTAEGSYDEVVYCSVCHEELSRAHKTTPKLTAARIPGDANDDGKVTVADVLLIQQKLAKWNVTINESNADVTGDGKVTVADVLLIQQKLAKWNVTLK